jgi:DNA replication protein DnaC
MIQSCPIEGATDYPLPLERGEIGVLEAVDALLGEELTLREGRRIKAALKMGRLVSIKTLAGFDFAFQPSLDRNRILALAQLEFIDRHEVVHFLGQPGCGKTPRHRPQRRSCLRLRLPRH